MDRMRRPARGQVENIHFKAEDTLKRRENAVIIAVFGSKAVGRPQSP